MVPYDYGVGVTGATIFPPVPLSSDRAERTSTKAAHSRSFVLEDSQIQTCSKHSAKNKQAAACRRALGKLLDSAPIASSAFYLTL